jgi:hypothetical protein
VKLLIATSVMFGLSLLGVITLLVLSLFGSLEAVGTVAVISLILIVISVGMAGLGAILEIAKKLKQ